MTGRPRAEPFSRRRRRPFLAALVAVALVTMGCGDGEAASTGAGSRGLTGALRVFAAASLAEAFTELGRAFEADHPGVEVAFNFAASSALARQIDDGAPADVFVSADETNMKKVTDAAKATNPVVIARNRLGILVEKSNPKAIGGLADLAEPGLVLVVCAPEVPCGKLAAAALSKAGVTDRPASFEENVKAVVSKVTLGEADAGIVYATDVKAAGDGAQGVDIDIADDPALQAVYPMAITAEAPNPRAARSWLGFVRSAAARATMADYGFLAP